MKIGKNVYFMDKSVIFDHKKYTSMGCLGDNLSFLIKKKKKWGLSVMEQS